MGRGWALLAVALLATGCGPAPEPPPPYLSIDEGEPWPNPPAIFESKTDQVELRLALDPAIRRYPALYDRFKADAAIQLKRFEEEALADRQGEWADRAPFSMDLSWAMGGETPRLASIEGYEGQYQGGNHPNHRVYSILWDRVQNREISRDALFRPDAGEALRGLLCRRLSIEKQRKIPYLRTVPLAELEHGECHWDMAEMPLVLAPTANGKTAAGVVYLLEPGMGGGYAAGAFRIFVPTAALRPLLADAYADQFSENPRRLPAN